MAPAAERATGSDPAASGADSEIQGSPNLSSLEEPITPEAPPGDPGAAEQVGREADRQALMVGTAASDAEQRMVAEGAGLRGRISASFVQQRSVADAGRRNAVARVHADAAVQSRAVTSTADDARTAITDAAGVSEQHAGEQVNALVAEAQQQATAQADRARAGAAERATVDPGLAKSADPDIAAGQHRIQSAVRDRGHTELTGSGDRAARAIQQRDAERHSKVYGPAAAGARQQIRSSSREADSAIRRGQATATAALGRTAATTERSIGQAHRKVSDALTARRAAALTEVESWVTRGKARIRGMAEKFTASIREHGRALAQVAGRSGPGAAATAVTALQGAAGEVAGAIGETSASLTDGVGARAGDHLSAVSAVAPQLAAGFAGVGEAGSEAARRGAEAFVAQTTQGKASAVADLQQAPARTAGALATEHARGIADSTGAVDKAGQVETAWKSDAVNRSQGGASQYADEAQRLGNHAADTPVQRLFGELINSMRSWLRDKLGDVLGGIVSGIIMALPSIIVAVGLLFAGPVGWVVLAGLLIVGAGLGIYGRFAEYSADHGGKGPGWLDGLALVGLGIADITGIPYIVEAAVGQRAFAPQPMSTFERWERGTQGVINLALVVAGGAKKIFGRGVGEPISTPNERVPTPVPAERGPTSVPGERGPTDGIPSETAPRPTVSRARMTELIKQIDAAQKSGQAIEFTPEHAEALRMNAELASGKWIKIQESEGRVPWDSIRNQLNLTRWRFLPRVPEAAAFIRNALMRFPEGPERSEMLRLLDGWVNGAPSGGGSPVPVPVPGPRHGDEPEE